MDQLIQPGRALSGFGQNTKGTVDLPIGDRYKAAQFVFVATAAAGQTLTINDFAADISVLMGNKPQRTHTALQLDQIQGKYGVDYQAQIYNFDTGVVNYVNGLPQAPQVAKKTICYLTLWFSEPWRKGWTAADTFALYTQWADGSKLTQFSLEVTGSNSANVDYTQPYSCKINLETDHAVGPLDANKKPVNIIGKWYRTVIPYTAAGVLDILNIPKADAISEFMFFCQTGDYINHAYLKVAGEIKRDLDQWDNNVYLLGRGFNTPYITRDVFPLVMDATDRIPDMLQTKINGVAVSDITLKVTLAAAAAGNKNLTMLLNRYGTPD